MNRKMCLLLAFTAIVSTSFLLSCQNPASSTDYPRIIIDTFFPTHAAPGYDIVSLFSEADVVNAGDPWSAAAQGTLAVDGNAGQGSNPNSDQPYWGYIDYQPAQPLTSGTVLYIRVTNNDKTTTGAYAIRVLTSPSSTYTYFSSENTSDTPYENDAPASIGDVPTNAVPISINQPLNRYLSPADDVDWFKLTLP